MRVSLTGITLCALVALTVANVATLLYKRPALPAACSAPAPTLAVPYPKAGQAVIDADGRLRWAYE